MVYARGDFLCSGTLRIFYAGIIGISKFTVIEITARKVSATVCIPRRSFVQFSEICFSKLARHVIGHSHSQLVRVRT